MTKLFKNYEEYLSVIITMIRGLSDESLNRIGLAINVCHSLQDDSEKIFRLNASVIKSLWEIPDAINMGIRQYFNKEFEKTKRLLEYHDYNCKSSIDCKVCQTKIITVNKLRDANERKRPEIHTK
jgi:thymidine kinase